MSEADDIRNLDIGITTAVATLVEALGMHWENQRQLQAGEPVTHAAMDFDRLINRNGCHWNAVIGRWQR